MTSTADSHMVDRRSRRVFGRRRAAGSMTRSGGRRAAARTRGLAPGRRAVAGAEGPSGDFPVGLGTALGDRQTLDDPQAGGLRPTVATDLLGGGTAGATGHQPELRVGAADARQAGRTVAVAGGHPGEGGLDQPVLTRMVGDDDAAPARLQQVQRLFESLGQLAELLVDGDADGLEDPAGRVAPCAAGGGRNGGSTTSAADPSSVKGRAATIGPGDPPGEPALAVARRRAPRARLRRTR